MSLGTSKQRLAALTRELWLRWDQTRTYWQDLKSQEFEHKYLNELVSGVDKASGVIDQLDKMIAKVRSDCE
jgi:hypothetical protein